MDSFVTLLKPIFCFQHFTPHGLLLKDARLFEKHHTYQPLATKYQNENQHQHYANSSPSSDVENVLLIGVLETKTYTSRIRSMCVK